MCEPDRIMAKCGCGRWVAVDVAIIGLEVEIKGFKTKYTEVTP